MPFGDGTGPFWAQGRGWRCRRALGFEPGFGRGFGRGFGWRRFAFGSPVEPVAPATSVEFSKEEKVKILEAEKAEAEAELKEIKKELEELKK